jgi:hypothetical protein
MKLKTILILLFLSVFFVGCGDKDKLPATSSSGEVRQTERNRVREENRKYVNQCALSLNETQAIRVFGISSDPCAPGVTHYSDVNYTISPKGIGFNIDLKIRLVILPYSVRPEREAEMLAQAKACIPKIQELYKRYDLYLNLDLELQETPPNDSFVSVSLIDEAGRSNSGAWYFKSPFFCETMLHEASHLFGFPDEYQDDSCPSREFISLSTNPYSIMDNSHHGFEFVDLFPRHMERILAPFCPANPKFSDGLTFTHL